MGIGAAIAGGVTSALGARRAGRAQERAADSQEQLGRDQLALSTRMYDEGVQRAQRAGAQQQRVNNRTANALRGLADAEYGRSMQAIDAGNAAQRRIIDSGAERIDGLVRAGAQRGNQIVRSGADRERGIVEGQFGRSNDEIDALGRRTTGLLDRSRTDREGNAGNALRQLRGIADDTFEAQREQFQPYADRGDAAGRAYAYEMGIGERPEDYAGFRETPGYQYRVDEGRSAIEGSAAARGGLFSGATLEALQRDRMGVADQTYGQHMDRLGNSERMGLTASGSIASAAGNRGAALTDAERMYAGLMDGITTDDTAARGNLFRQLSEARLGAIGNRAAGLSGANAMQTGGLADINTGMTTGLVGSAGGRTDALTGLAGQTAGQRLGAIGDRFGALSGIEANRGTTRMNIIGGTADMRNTLGQAYQSNAGNAFNFMGNALANRGDAQAAGAAGFAGAVNGGIQNYAYLNALNNGGGQGGTAGAGGAGGMFGNFFRGFGR